MKAVAGTVFYDGLSKLLPADFVVQGHALPINYSDIKNFQPDVKAEVLHAVSSSIRVRCSSELSLRKLILFLDDMDALCPMLRDCFFGMNSSVDMADTQYILRYHGCYVKSQALILQKLSKLTQYQPNRRRKRPYEVKHQQQRCLSYGNRKNPNLHLCEILEIFPRKGVCG